jgi:hypothetical protein
MRWAWWVAVLVVVTGCLHVDLRLPPQPMSPEQRVATYNTLHPTHETIFYSNKGSSRMLTLGDGTDVRYVEDLVPVVAPDSTTARNARSAAHHRNRSLWWSIPGGLTAMVGGFMWFSPDENAGITNILGPGMFFAGLAAIGVGFYHRFAYAGAQQRVHDAYDSDLAAHLNVCAQGLTIVPCEMLPPPTQYPPPAQYPPAPAKSQP